jgi:hypothetical protein
MEALKYVEMHPEVVEAATPIEPKYTKVEPLHETIHPAKSLFDFKSMPTYTSAPLNEVKPPC